MPPTTQMSYWHGVSASPLYGLDATSLLTRHVILERQRKAGSPRPGEEDLLRYDIEQWAKKNNAS